MVGRESSPGLSIYGTDLAGMIKTISSITDGILLMLWISVVPLGPFWLPNALGLTFLTIGFPPGHPGPQQSSPASHAVAQVMRIEGRLDLTAANMAADD